MAFLFAKQFPAGCVVETDSDPAEIRIGGDQSYPVGVSLEQAMKWIWKSRAFTGSGSGQILSECCEISPVYTVFDFPNSQSTSGLDAAKTKMSELICPTSYEADFTFSGTRVDNFCEGSPSTSTAEAGFGFFIGLDIYVDETPIYLYNDKYYIGIAFIVGGGFSLNEDSNRTYFAGNFTIDGINFPLYANPPVCSDIPQANFTCTTSLEREAS
jgi:hypothetical protein